MTIKELEERTGMTRANIRYYESEGLVSPVRQENGYRDYSEEDAKTLEKIRLLRELHLDIDTIRMVQNGALPLERALFTLLTRLEGDKAAIGRAAEVCRALEQAGVEYGALEPRPWLAQLNQSQLAPPPRTVSRYDIRPEQEWQEPAAGHSVMRWLARSLDTMLHSLVIYAILLLGLRWNFLNGNGLVDWFVGVLCSGFALLCEPFWLHFWGWTPGKWIFGLKLRGPSGDKVTLGEGFARSVRVFGYVFLFSIPLVNLILLVVCLYRLYHDDDLPWDVGGEFEFEYTQEERRLYGVKYLLAAAAAIGAVVLIVLLCQRPLHRGKLTEAEYYENINHYLDTMTQTGDRLDEAGQWELRGSVSFGSLPEITVETVDGAVTAVTLTDREDGSFIYQRADINQIALLALAAAEHDLWPTEYDGWTSLLADQWDSFETEYLGIQIVQTVERSGYSGVGQILAAEVGREQSYERTVTISLLGDEENGTDH